MALMAGNGVVLKPASLTCLIGQRIQRVFERAGLPEGVLRVIHGGGAVGQALVESSVAKVFFTGSVEVGRGGGRDVRAASQGLGARARRQGPNARARRRAPPERRVGRAVGRLRQRRADVLGDRAGLRGARGGRPLHRGRRRRRQCPARRRPARLVHPGRADGLTGAVRDRPRPGGRRRRGRGAGALRRTGEGARVRRRCVLRPHRPHRCHPRHADHARGGVRAGAADRHGGQRGRGHRAGQRLAVRAWCLGLDARPPARRAHRARAGIGDGLDQRPHALPRGLPVRVGRGEGLGPRPGALQVRLLRMRERQAAGRGSPGASATSGGTRTTRRSAAASRPRRGCCTGARPTAGRPGARAALALAKVAGRTLRRSRRR